LIAVRAIRPLHSRSRPPAGWSQPP
jgi:hypothetical protein